MRRVALAVALLLASSGAYADPSPPSLPPSPPPWMPAPQRPPTRNDEEQIRHLKREVTAYGTIGLALVAGGIAVNVVALDVPQAEQSSRQPDGSIIEQHVRGDANWAELAGGIALTATGLALAGIAYVKLKQLRKLQANE